MTDEAADAYSLPGLPCRIVVTTGMIRASRRNGTFSPTNALTPAACITCSARP